MASQDEVNALMAATEAPPSDDGTSSRAEDAPLTAEEATTKGPEYEPENPTQHDLSSDESAGSSDSSGEEGEDLESKEDHKNDSPPDPEVVANWREVEAALAEGIDENGLAPPSLPGNLQGPTSNIPQQPLHKLCGITADQANEACIDARKGYLTRKCAQTQVEANALVRENLDLISKSKYRYDHAALRYHDIHEDAERADNRARKNLTAAQALQPEPEYVPPDVLTLDLTQDDAQQQDGQPQMSAVQDAFEGSDTHEVELTGFMVTPGPSDAAQSDPILLLDQDQISRLENVLQSEAAQNMLGEVFIQETPIKGDADPLNMPFSEVLRQKANPTEVERLLNQSSASDDNRDGSSPSKSSAWGIHPPRRSQRQIDREMKEEADRIRLENQAQMKKELEEASTATSSPKPASTTSSGGTPTRPKRERKIPAHLKGDFESTFVDKVLQKGQDEKKEEESGEKKDEPKAEASDSDAEVPNDDDSESEADWHSEDDPERLWCVCQQPHNNRFMICCDLCLDWFHGKCVGITKKMGQDMEDAGREWRCPECTEQTEARVKEVQSKEPHATATHKRTAFHRRKMSDSSTGEKKITQSRAAKEKTCFECENKLAELSESLYCSQDCIDKHVRKARAAFGKGNQTSSSLIVMEPKSNTMLTGPQAPSMANLEQWAKEHPTFHIVLPNQQMPTSKFYGKKAPVHGSSHSLGASQGSKNVNRGLKVIPPMKHSLSPGGGLKTGISIASPSGAVGKNLEGYKVIKTVSMAKTGAHDANRQATKRATDAAKRQLEKRKQQLAQQQQKPPHHTLVRRSTSHKSESPATPSPSISNPKPIRDNARKGLKDALKTRISKAKSITPLPDDKLNNLVEAIEHELFKLYNRDPGAKYKAKYRSLVFNIKDEKNAGLFRKIIESKISPKHLVALTAEEMASKELQQWREAELKHDIEKIRSYELDLIAMGNKFVMKSHKGEQLIESDQAEKATKTSKDARLPEEMAKEMQLVDESTLEVEDEYESWHAKTWEHSDHAFDAQCDVCSGRKTLDEFIVAKEKRKKAKNERDRKRRKDRSRHEKSSSRRHHSDSHRSHHRHHHRRSSSKEVDEKKAKLSSGEPRKHSHTTKHSNEGKSTGDPNRSANIRHHQHHRHHQDKHSEKKEPNEDHKEHHRRRHHRKHRHSRSHSLDDKRHSQSRSPTEKSHSEVSKKEQETLSKSSSLDLTAESDAAALLEEEDDVRAKLAKAEKVLSEFQHMKEKDPQQFQHTWSDPEDDGDDDDDRSPRTPPLPMSNEEVSSTVVIKTPEQAPEASQADPAVWKGDIHMPDVIRFSVTAHAMSGNTDYLTVDLRESLKIVGRIHKPDVWKYILQVKEYPSSREFLVVRLQPATADQLSNYNSFFEYLTSRERLAVVGELNRSVKDCYIFPLSKNDSLPECLMPLDGPGLQELGGDRPNLLLALIVRSCRKKPVDLEKKYKHQLQEAMRLQSREMSHKKNKSDKDEESGSGDDEDEVAGEEYDPAAAGLESGPESGEEEEEAYDPEKEYEEEEKEEDNSESQGVSEHKLDPENEKEKPVILEPEQHQQLDEDEEEQTDVIPGLGGDESKAAPGFQGLPTGIASILFGAGVGAESSNQSTSWSSSEPAAPGTGSELPGLGAGGNKLRDPRKREYSADSKAEDSQPVKKKSSLSTMSDADLLAMAKAAEESLPQPSNPDPAAVPSAAVANIAPGLVIDPSIPPPSMFSGPPPPLGVQGQQQTPEAVPPWSQGPPPPPPPSAGNWRPPGGFDVPPPSWQAGGPRPGGPPSRWPLRGHHSGGKFPGRGNRRPY